MFDDKHMTDRQQIALHMFEPMGLTKEVIGALVTKRDGQKIGRVYDVHIRKGNVVGIVVGPEKFHFRDIVNIMKATKTIPHIIKKVKGIDNRIFLPWRCVRKIKRGIFVLEKCKKVKGAKPVGVSAIKRILDEQVVDSKNRYIGRVDEVQFVYEYGERDLKVVGFYSGASAVLARIGLETYTKNLSKLFKIQFGKNIIPWKLIRKIEPSPPSRIILKIRVK